jgi:hypothetical protein
MDENFYFLVIGHIGYVELILERVRDTMGPDIRGWAIYVKDTAPEVTFPEVDVLWHKGLGSQDDLTTSELLR